VTDIREPKTADGTSGNGISGRGEDSVNDLVRLSDIDEVRGALDLVEVERNLARNGTVESGLEKGCPAMLEFVRASAITLAHAGHSRIHALKLKYILKSKLKGIF